MKTFNDDLSFEIFGDQVVPNELIDGETEIGFSDELPIDSLNNDFDFSNKAMSGVRKTLKNEDQNTQSDPKLASDDIDADYGDTASEEVSLADDPTPDQDQVESVAEPWGLTQKYSEELDISKKTRRLERKRLSDEIEELSKEHNK